MEKKETINDVQKKWMRVCLRIIQFGGFALLTKACTDAALYSENMSFGTNGIVLVTFFLFPFLLLGALYGYFIAYISFAFTFVAVSFKDMDSLYSMAIYLVATTCFALFGQYFWFMTKRKTALAALITLVCTSVIEFGCLTVINSQTYDFSVVWHLGLYFARDAGVIFVLAFLLHLFYTKAPDVWKLPFPIGIGYTKVYQENKEAQRNLRKTRVSAKITTIIIGIELVLGISVSVFTIALFPDMKEMMVYNIENDSDLIDRIEQSLDKDDFLKGLEKVDFAFNYFAITYDVKMMLLMLCIGVPLGGFTNFFAKIAIGAPLGQMSDFMYEFANADDDKKLEVSQNVDKIVVNSRDEIRIVYESLKQMVHSTEDYIARMKEEQKLQSELEVAQKASEAKTSFLSNMSHEIRTPINAVLGMNEMILRESSEPQTLEYANNVKSAGTQLLGIINDILDFNKIEAGKMDILPVEYNISSTINDLMNMILAKAKDKGLELEVNVDETLPQYLFGDEIRIKQCVTNVLTNAVKYTEEGTVTMNITYKKVDDENIMLGFQVVDTGIGIKEEDLGKLFSPFERIEEIRNRTIEGTGLGMSIVKKLLAMMDTKLIVKSVYGEGSDFSFEVKQKVVSWEEIGDFKERYKEYVKSLSKYHEKFTAPEAEILVVDDTPMNLTVVKGLLKNTKIKIDTAESGMETLEKVKVKKYDAIFIDHRMPEMDGLETLTAMKTLEGNLNIGVPCIALTANAGANARDEYLAAGFDDYLSKPVNGELMEDMLKALLPAEKVIDYVEAEKGHSGDGTAEAAAEESALDKLQGINLEEAVKNCGSRELLEEVVKEFLISIDSKADNIEKFAEEKDYRNYTVAVHALKSSARLVGALELSADAAYLEQCGNDENEAEIVEKTPALLENYRSYKEKLSQINGDVREEDLPEIPVDELEGAFKDMKELLEAYDFDTADGLMKMLSDYSIPSYYKEKYNKVKELMAAVDRDKLLEIL